MSGLLSAIEEYRAEELTHLPDAQAEDDFAEIQRGSEILEAERLRRLADLDRRGGYRRDGYLSAASWLASSFNVA